MADRSLAHMIEARFETWRLADLELMVPMTRQRATAKGVPTDLMARYFGQRASAGLVLTDCTMVGPLAHAYEH